MTGTFFASGLLRFSNISRSDLVTCIGLPRAIVFCIGVIVCCRLRLYEEQGHARRKETQQHTKYTLSDREHTCSLSRKKIKHKAQRSQSQRQNSNSNKNFQTLMRHDPQNNTSHSRRSKFHTKKKFKLCTRYHFSFFFLQHLTFSISRIYIKKNTHTQENGYRPSQNTKTRGCNEDH